MNAPAHVHKIVPASDLDAEGVVLSAAILNGPPAIAELRERLEPRHFYADANRRIYEAVLELDADGKAVDTVAIARLLRGRGELAKIGGTPYLAQICEATPAVANVLEHASAIRDKWRVREAERLVKRISVELGAGADVGPVGDYLSIAVKELGALVERGDGAQDVLLPEQIFAPLPPVRHVVQALDLCAGAPGMWAGYGYSKKTLAAQAAALAIAAGTGKIWNSFAASTGRVLHLDYEQGARLTRERYQRLAVPMMLSPQDLGDRLALVAMPRLMLDAHAAEDRLARLVDGYTLVIVDSLRAAAPSLDENSSEARRPLDVMTRVSERTGAAFLVIHHARKPNAAQSGGAKMAIRGTGAFFDATSSVLLFEGEKGQASRVSHEKARATGILTDDFELDVADVPDGANPRAGLLVTARQAPTRDESDEQRARASLSARQDRVRAELRELFRGSPEQGGVDEIAARLKRSVTDVRGIVKLMVADRELETLGSTRDRRHRWIG